MTSNPFSASRIATSSPNPVPAPVMSTVFTGVLPDAFRPAAILVEGRPREMAAGERTALPAHRRVEQFHCPLRRTPSALRVRPRDDPAGGDGVVVEGAHR